MDANIRGDPFSRYRFLSGLSRGLIILTVAALFWVALAAWGLGGSLWTLALAPLLVAAGAAGVGAWRLTTKARMVRSSDKDPADPASIRRLTIWFRVTSTLQTVFIILAGVLSQRLERPDLLWPLIGLVVSLHFIPLGRLFRVRPYYATGIAGTIVAAVAILGFSGSDKLVVAGVGLSIVMIGTSAYVLVNAERLADEAASTSNWSRARAPSG
jgi:hypothetical protein